MLTIMHFTQLALRYFAQTFQDNQMMTWRIVTNFVASIVQLSFIIITIGFYVDAFAPKLNSDNKTYSPSSLPFGAWHMANVYQYWVFLEVISFFTNFVVIMLALLSASLSHLKIERVLKVPAGFFNNAGQ